MEEKNIYLISDTHFGDEEIIKYENRENVYSSEEEIIKIWNNKMKKTDIIYMLGDIFHSSVPYEKCKRIIENLNGEKRLIMGNHDNQFTIKQWYEMGFYEVVDGAKIIEKYIILSHEPMYTNANMPYVNIHGHIHSDDKYKTYSSQGACVCVERIGYVPISLKYVGDKILKLRKEIQN